MVQYKYTPKTLDDEMIKDGLCAVGTLSKNPLSFDKYFVVGGVAVQSYLPSSCRRPTVDIDLAVLKQLYKQEFKKFAESAFDYLSDKGYKVGLRKVRRAFCLVYDSKNRESNFISFPRHNRESLKNIEFILDREISHARTKIVEGRVDSCQVACPEDIVIRKFARAVNRLKRNPLFEEQVSSMKKLTIEEIKSAIEKMKLMREELYRDYDLSNAEKLRFISDLHDIRLLSELTGLNPFYFKEAVSSWNAFDEESFEKDLISRAVLPDELFIESLIKH